jgi:Tfp pilus assembly protein PilF
VRRDQALFLAAGLVIGIIIGLIFGVIATRPDVAGGAPKTASAPAPAPAPAGMPPGDAAGGDPHAGGGMGSVSNALSELRTRLDKNPNDVEALVSLGEMFLQANMRDRAAEPFERAANLVGNNGQLAARAAGGLAAAGDPTRALALARKAMDLDKAAPGPAEVATRVALVLGDIDGARASLEEFRRRATNVPDAAQIAGQLGSELDRVRGVVEAGKNKPNDYAAQVALGNLEYDAARWAGAEAAYKRALAVRADDPNVMTDYGIVLYQLNRPEEALRQFENALAKNPSFVNAAVNGVVVAASTGDKTRGRAWLSRLKAIAPQHPAIAQFEERLK